MKNGLLVDVKFNNPGMFEYLEQMLPGRQIVNWNNSARKPDDISGLFYALGWEPDEGLFASMPDLKVMFSVGAGVDHMLVDANLPELPLVRFVDESLTKRMSEWVCLQCLLHLRQQPTYDRQRTERLWLDHPQSDAANLRVGIMGLGVLGRDAARKLKMLGFQVNGWSRSKKTIAGINCYESKNLDKFLANSDILVGLLPLTGQTTGIFNASLFSKLPKTTPIGGPVFINAGRGKSQVEADIVNALRNGGLKGVSLDVFEREPLPKDSPLWNMDNVVITPHVASVSDAKALAAHVARQIERFESGLELQYVVNKHSGY